MPDPTPEKPTTGSSEETISEEDRAHAEYLAYIMSPEFTRELSEHFKRATRRAIEEGKAAERRENSSSSDSVEQ